MEVYAELPKKLCSKIEENGFFDLPNGVRLTRKRNSRFCYFDCSNDIALADLTEVLYKLGVPWQEN